MRASDDDRRRVVAQLERHTAAGRLSLEEFSDRVRIVYAAATHGDLAVVTRDLPAEDGSLAADAGHRQLVFALLLAAATIALLAIVLAIAR
jgi:hypothetical protein